MLSALVLCVCVPVLAQAPVEDPYAALLPHPQQLESIPGQLTLDLAAATFVLRAPDPDAGKRLGDRLRETQERLRVRRAAHIAEHVPGGYALLVFSGEHLPAAFAAVQLAALPEAGRAEGYGLEVAPEGIRIAADTERGLFYGMMSMEQLLRAAALAGTAAIPCARISDWPAVGMRGFHEDYGRDQLPTVEDHKRSIRLLAQYKANTHLWFIEPDHFVYAFDPEIGAKYDRFTFDEIREVVAYAKQYYIEVIPVVELLAHMENTLSNPKYAHLAEKEGTGTLCPVNDESIQFAEKLMGEIAAAFDSKYFHCGLDESAVIGQGKSADAVKTEGIEKVYARYYTRLHDTLRDKHGKTMMMYADIVLNHPSVMNLLPKDIVMMFWDYIPRPRYEGLDNLVKNGFPTTTLAGMWDWVNLYPLYNAGIANIDMLAAQTAEVGSLGHFVSNWGDWNMGAAGANLSELNFYGALYCSILGWKPQPIAVPEYSKAFATHFFGLSSDYGEAFALLAACQGTGLENNQRARRMFHSVPAEKLPEMAKAAEADLAFWRDLKASAERAHVLLKKAAPKMNKDILQSHDLAARMLALSADFALAYREVAVAMDAPAFNGRRFAEQFEALSERQQALWLEYRDVYAATNRPINLQYLQIAWDKSKADLAEFARNLRTETIKK